MLDLKEIRRELDRYDAFILKSFEEVVDIHDKSYHQIISELLSKISTKLENEKGRELLNHITEDTYMRYDKGYDFTHIDDFDAYVFSEFIDYVLPYIDDTILDLLAERLKLVEQVVLYKISEGKGVESMRRLEREVEIFTSFTDRVEDSDSLKKIYSLYKYLVLPTAFEIEILYMTKMSS